MTIETATITPLRPADPTGPLRSRRARAKRKTAANPVNMPVERIYENPNEINVRDTVRRVVRAEPARLPWSVWPLATVTIGLMAVSLTHLSGGIEDLTSIPSWQSWAMAIGIDALLVATALAQLTAPPEVKRDIAVVAHLMEGVTLVMSAGLNSLAFSGGHFDLAHWAPIAFGCYVPQ